MKEKTSLFLPILLMLMFAVTRWPGVMPENFSAAYAIAFCAGVYFAGGIGWWLPLVTLAVTDLLLNWYYSFPPHWFQLFSYGAFALLIWLGRRMGPRASFVKLLAGGMFGAVLFYVITNTASWFFNPFNSPEYTKTLSGWVTALTKGMSGYPETYKFFRNTMLSSGLFTGVFVGVMKLSEARRPKEAEEEEAEEEAEPAGEKSSA